MNVKKFVVSPAYNKVFTVNMVKEHLRKKIVNEKRSFLVPFMFKLVNHSSRRKSSKSHSSKSDILLLLKQNRNKI